MMDVAEDLVGSETNASETPASPQTKKRILIVEDEAVIAVMLEDALTEAGYETATAYDGSMALNLLKNSTAPFDAIVTDILLPGPVSGLDIARRSREINEATGVVFVTGDSFGEWDPALIEGSVLHEKPVPIDVIIAGVAGVLAKPL